MSKTLSQFKKELSATYINFNLNVLEVDFREMYSFSIKVNSNEVYLESDAVLVHSNKKFYFFNNYDFTRYRTDTSNGNFFTLGECKTFNDYAEAVAYMQSLKKEVTVLSVNATPNYSNLTYYVNILVG